MINHSNLLIKYIFVLSKISAAIRLVEIKFYLVVVFHAEVKLLVGLVSGISDSLVDGLACFILR